MQVANSAAFLIPSGVRKPVDYGTHNQFLSTGRRNMLALCMTTLKSKTVALGPVSVSSGLKFGPREADGPLSAIMRPLQTCYVLLT